jgi:hypothetical protein
VDNNDEYDDTYTYIYVYPTVCNVFGVEYLDCKYDYRGDDDGDK